MTGYCDLLLTKFITEKMIDDDPRVKCSVMFGRGKFQNGVLIEPTEDFAFDANNTQQLMGFRNAIWRVVVSYHLRPTTDACFMPQAYDRIRQRVRTTTLAHFQRGPCSFSCCIIIPRSDGACQMILVADPLKPFQFNAKGLLRRGIILDDYKDEIEALYEEVENSARSDVDPPATWDLNSTLAFVRAVVESTLRRPIPDDADIFRNGGDR